MPWFLLLVHRLVPFLAISVFSWNNAIGRNEDEKKKGALQTYLPRGTYLLLSQVLA